MRQKNFTKSLLLLSLVAFTACPNNDRNNNAPPIIQQDYPNNPNFPNNPNNPNFPNNPNNPNNPDPNNPYGSGQLIYKDFDCVLEAYRNRPRKFLGLIRYNEFTPIGRTIFKISFIEGAANPPFYLKTRFPIFDRGGFGEITMDYNAAGGKNKSDMLIITDRGLNDNIKVVQQGFAGSEVKIEAFSDSDTDDMHLFVACKGSPRSQFKNGENSANKTHLTCVGSSYTGTSSKEEINWTQPLNSIQEGEELAISSSVSIKVENSASMITFNGSLDLERNATITSTASLKSEAKFRLKDISKKKHNTSAETDVTCKLE